MTDSSAAIAAYWDAAASDFDAEPDHGLGIEDLGGNVELWGGPVTDERYALIARI